MKPYAAMVRELGARTLLAERLRITARAYSDLERGKYCVSAATLLFMLSMLSTAEQQTLLGQFVKCVQLAEEGSVA